MRKAVAAVLGESLYPASFGPSYGGSSANISQLATKNLIYPLTGGSNGNLVDANYAGLMMTGGGAAAQLPKSSIDMSVKGLASSFFNVSGGNLFETAALAANAVNSASSASSSSLGKG